jgi:hypothetical protein
MPPGGLEDILKDILGGGGAGVPGGGGSAPSPRGGQPDLNDILRDILGGGGGMGGRIPPEAQQDMQRRSRERIDDALGRRSSGGTAADDLLNSVEQAIRRR